MKTSDDNKRRFSFSFAHSSHTSYFLRLSPLLALSEYRVVRVPTPTPASPSSLCSTQLPTYFIPTSHNMDPTSSFPFTRFDINQFLICSFIPNPLPLSPPCWPSLTHTPTSPHHFTLPTTPPLTPLSQPSPISSTPTPLPHPITPQSHRDLRFPTPSPFSPLAHLLWVLCFSLVHLFRLGILMLFRRRGRRRCVVSLRVRRSMTCHQRRRCHLTRTLTI